MLSVTVMDSKLPRVCKSGDEKGANTWQKKKFFDPVPGHIHWLELVQCEGRVFVAPGLCKALRTGASSKRNLLHIV